MFEKHEDSDNRRNSMEFKRSNKDYESRYR